MWQVLSISFYQALIRVFLVASRELVAPEDGPVLTCIPAGSLSGIRQLDRGSGRSATSTQACLLFALS